MTATPVFLGERRRYWLSLAALAVMLPAAILVHSGSRFQEWLRRDMRDPIAVEKGASQPYGGADWRLTDMTRLPGNLPGTAVVVAEFEAVVGDPERLRGGASCTVVLTDMQGRRWRPLFLTEPVVRKMKPEAAEKPRCGAFESTGNGDTLMMAESFVVPEGAQGLALSVALTKSLPEYLLFR
ncbi:hypothetical protein [Mesorhizobium sp. A556]